MPGAADRAIDQEPLDEGAMIVRTVGADRERLRSLPRQQHRFVADMTEQLAAVGEVLERHAF